MLAGRHSPERWERYLAVAKMELEKEHYEAAESLLLEAVRAVYEPIGRKHLALANVFRQLGHHYGIFEKRYDRAGANYQRALAITETAAPKHPDLSGLYLEVGGSYSNQGDFENAEVFMRQALAFVEKHSATDVGAISNAVSALAKVLDTRGKVQEAEGLYLRNIKIMEQGITQHHLFPVWIAYSLADLAEFYRRPRLLCFG